MNKTTPPPSRQPGSVALVLKFVANLSGVLLGLGLSMALAAGIALALAYANLPDISELSAPRTLDRRGRKLPHGAPGSDPRRGRCYSDRKSVV